MCECVCVYKCVFMSIYIFAVEMELENIESLPSTTVLPSRLPLIAGELDAKVHASTIS